MTPAQSLPEDRTIRLEGDPTDLGQDQKKAMTIKFNGQVLNTPFSNLLPPLSSDEEEALANDIAKHGVVTPVVVTDWGEVIDGHHCLRLAAGLELQDIPIKSVTGLTEAEAQQLAISLNVHRRHLDQEQRRDLIAQILKAAPKI